MFLAPLARCRRRSRVRACSPEIASPTLVCVRFPGYSTRVSDLNMIYDTNLLFFIYLRDLLRKIERVLKDFRARRVTSRKTPSRSRYRCVQNGVNAKFCALRSRHEQLIYPHKRLEKPALGWGKKMSNSKMFVFIFYNLHALDHSSAKRRIEDLPHFQRKPFSIFLPHFQRKPCWSDAGLSKPCPRVEDHHHFTEY